MTQQRLENAALLSACRSGDERGWRQLIERYGALILSVPRRHGFDETVADEVFSDVCMILLKSLGTIRDPERLGSWLIRTSTRAMWRAARRHRRTAADPLGHLESVTPPPDEVAETLEREQLVREALARLPDRCRRLLTILYFTETDAAYDEAARRVGMSRGSVGPTRIRCLKKMQVHLQPLIPGEEPPGAE